MVKRRDPSLLECNGGYVTLKKNWAKYLLCKLNFVNQTLFHRCSDEKGLVHEITGYSISSECLYISYFASSSMLKRKLARLRVRPCDVYQCRTMCFIFTKLMLIHEIFIPKINFFKIKGFIRKFSTTKIWSHTVYKMIN